MRLNWGVLGAGRIAGVFAKGLRESQSGCLLAVASKHLDKANAFGDEFGAGNRYGNYDALFADERVNAVYIATLHPTHCELAVKAAEAGKHVLCEKPLTMNYLQAESVVHAARNNDVFLMEAFMYRCHPQTKKLYELIRGGAIGELKFIDARFSFDSGPEPTPRLAKAELGGGAILDLGCYCASISRLAAGAALGKPFADPVEVHAVGQVGEVDECSTAILRFEEDIIAQLTTAFTADLGSYVTITGSEGRIHIPSPWFSAEPINITREDVTESIEITAERSIYAIEADIVAANVSERQAPEVTSDDSLGNMRLLDSWRRAIGMQYEFEGASHT